MLTYKLPYAKEWRSYVSKTFTLQQLRHNSVKTTSFLFALVLILFAWNTPQVLGQTCTVDGGTIATLDDTNICVDGNPDPINVAVMNSMGDIGGWIITDDNDNILALPDSPPFNLDPAGIGTCLIWYIRYESGLTGKMIGNNLSDLSGCYDLSNAIAVNRETPDGGMVSLTDGSTSYANCAGDIVFDAMHTTTAPNLSYWYIITDNNDNILAYHNTANGNTLDLSAAPAGECHVWGWNYKGEPNPVMGDHISTLADGDCEAISSNWITVYRETPDGGMVSLTDGSTSYANCAGDIVFDVMHTTTAPNLSYWYIITDNNDNILAYQNSANGNTLDLSVAPAGECHVWGWNYKGEPNPVMGDHISTLADGDCEAISSNWITVYREIPDGGTVGLLDGSTSYTNCAGDIVFDVMHTTTAPNLSYWYIITDNNDNILAYHNTANGSTLDLSGAPAGECHVWGWNYKGEPNPVMGEHISTLEDGSCEDISDNWITVYRDTADGGTVSLRGGGDSYANCAGDIVFTVSHTTTANRLSYWYIITDNNDNILAYQNAADGNIIDLSGAPPGECHVWGWSYKGEPNPVMGEHISTLEDGNCEDISDNWLIIYREVPDGGTVSLTDGSTSYSNCAGDIVFDVMHSTTAPNLSYWYIITDENDNILAYHNTVNGNTLDLSGAPAGECHIWGWNYKGEPDPVMGEHISTLEDGDCEDISSNWITVYREIPDGGTVSLLDGSTTYSNCVGNIIFDVTHTTTAPNLSYWYIITDDNDNILAYHNTANGNTLDLSGAPAGECHIWGWSYKGEPNPILGEHISTLADGTCEDISSNWITVTRTEGSLTLSEGSSSTTPTGLNVYSLEACEGQAPYDVSLDIESGFASVQEFPSNDPDCILIQITYATGAEWTLMVSDGTCGDQAFTSDNIATMPLLMIDNFDTSNESCPGTKDGSAMVNVSGGDTSCGDYTYDWTGPNGFTSTDNPINDLASGTYNVTIMDCAGTTVSTQIYVARTHGGGRGGRGSSGACKTALEDMITEFGFKPNPASDFVQVDFDIAEDGVIFNISLTDLAGRTLQEIEVDGNGSVTMDVSDVANGLYLVHLRANGQVVRQEKLILVK